MVYLPTNVPDWIMNTNGIFTKVFVWYITNMGTSECR